MSIREIIESKFKAAGLTKREAAARAGIHSGNINGMITAPSWPTLERLAAAMGVSVSELIRDPSSDDSSTPNPAGVPVCPRCGAPLVISITTPAGLQDESSTHDHDQTAAAVQDDRGNAVPLP